MSGYRVEHVKFGMVVYGRVPLKDIPGLVAAGREHKWTILDEHLVEVLPGASLVFTEEWASKEWRINLGVIDEDGKRPCVVCKKEAHWDGEVEVPHLCRDCEYGP